MAQTTDKKEDMITEKQFETFCNHYARNGYASEAAKEIGIPSDVAREIGEKILERPAIKSRINEIIKTIKLTDKQEAFCMAYVRCLCKTKSSKAANYNTKFHEQQGAETYRKPYVRARINELRKEVIEEDELEDVLAAHVANLKAFNIMDYVGEDGEYDVAELSKIDIPGAVNTYKTKTTLDPETGRPLTREITVKAVDTIRSIQEIGKIKKITDDTANVNNFILLNQSDQDKEM